MVSGNLEIPASCNIVGFILSLEWTTFLNVFKTCIVYYKIDRLMSSTININIFINLHQSESIIVIKIYCKRKKLHLKKTVFDIYVWNLYHLFIWLIIKNEIY